MSIYSDGSYLSAHPTWHIEDAAFKARQVAALLERHDIAPRSLCDIGCGVGEVLRDLRRRFGPSVQFRGYDISSDAIEAARKLGEEGIEFFAEDPTSGEIEHHDVLLALDVAEHIDDIYGFLRRLKVLATWKVFHIPLEITASSALRGYPFVRAWKNLGHVHSFNRDRAVQALEYCGYEIVEARYTPAAIEGSGKRLKTRVANVVRRAAFPLAPHLTVRLIGGYSLIVLAR